MANFIALTDNNTLLSFASSNLEEVTSTTVTGIEGTLIGIDVRPADGQLYGLTTANKIYTLDPNGFSGGSFMGDFTLNHHEERQLLHDALYINLHTAEFGAGELRGQIEVELENDIVAFGLPIDGAQEVGDMTPPDDAPAMGTFNVIYDDATNTLRVTGTFMDLTGELLPVGDVDAEGNPQSAIHLHQGAVGENGPILRNLTVNDDGSFEGTFTLTDAEEALLLDQALYVNIHTDEFGAGELRGQLAVEVENDVVVLGVPIEEAQEVGDMTPPVGPAMGMFDVIYDNSTNRLLIDGEFTDITSPLLPVGAVDTEGNPQSAVHLHQGRAGENGPIIRNLVAMDEVATLVSTLSEPFGGGVVSGFDFNPVPDRLRLVGDNDQNFRINVDTGEVIVDGDLAFVKGDANFGVNPNITASAYTNSFEGATSTQLFNIDTLLNTLVLQNPPNDGGLVTIGELGVNFGIVGGFDIVSSAEGENMGFAAADGMLYSIDLETGAATNLGMIGDGSAMNLLGFAAVGEDMVIDMPDMGMDHPMMDDPMMDDPMVGVNLGDILGDLVTQVGRTNSLIGDLVISLNQTNTLFNQLIDRAAMVDLSTLDQSLLQPMGLSMASNPSFDSLMSGTDGIAVMDVLQAQMAEANAGAMVI